MDKLNFTDVFNLLKENRSSEVTDDSYGFLHFSQAHKEMSELISIAFVSF